DVQNLGESARPIMGRVIERCLPFAERNAEIPTKLLLLAIRHLDDAKLQSLMSSPRFIKPLPQEVKQLLALLSQRDRSAPPAALARAVASIDEEARESALLAFSKMAYSNKRIDLIDERALNEL